MVFLSEDVLLNTSMLVEQLRQRNLTISFAESLTAGSLCFAFAQVQGTARVHKGGFVVYNDEVKSAVLGVSPYVLEKYGAVSFPAAKDMALGVLEKTNSNIAVAVTGYAGNPEGMPPEENAGLVYIGTAYNNFVSGCGGLICVEVEQYSFSGGRLEVQAKTVSKALKIVLRGIENPHPARMF